ncbi:MAG: peptidylprolyl isomerase [Hydrogenophaga sp.]|uniref:peptidylprolyl isomerase n=1 Tax=Hydrogenophaga sp. TaxID=1904254 RepID=UPI003D9ABA3A
MTERRSLASRRWTALALGVCLACGGAAQAQSLRPSSQLNLLRGAPVAPGPRTVDYIVALVNSEPVTNNEVRARLLRVEQQLTQQGAALPPRDQLARQVMEQLVNERAQLQQASEQGLRVDEPTLARAEQSIASQNQLSVDEFRRRVAADGMDINFLRNELRNQILLQQLREREVDARVRVTENDIDDFVREQKSNTDLGSLELNLSHILVRVPESATPEQIKALEARAQRAADRARKGDDFGELAREYSDAPEGAQGGQFGMRPADRLPEIFVTATRDLRAGEIAGPVRSPAGFHVLKLVEKRQAGLPDVSVTQTRARHILLRPGPQLSQNDAVTRLTQYREQIASGKANFEALAREHSQDGSASAGGDLGWASPGQFVPEFEEAMNGLRPGAMSLPVVSRFGVHLIRVDERRQMTLSDREQREIVRGLVREKKAADALETWAQDLRSRAYVEYREAPQP